MILTYVIWFGTVSLLINLWDFFCPRIRNTSLKMVVKGINFKTIL